MKANVITSSLQDLGGKRVVWQSLVGLGGPPSY